MIWAVWKLIIFTSMVKRPINTSRNEERVTLQVYDTCLQMFLFFGLRRKDCLSRSTLSSDTRGRPALFPLQRQPVVSNCWYQRLMLLGDGDHCWIVAGMPAEQKQLIRASQIAAHKTPSAPESPLSLCYGTDRERRGEWDCACAQNLNTCCFVPCGKLTSACVLKAAMSD